jgi:hypothetical protein
MGKLANEFHRDLPAHRKTTDHNRSDTEAVEKGGEIGGEGFEVRDTWHNRGLSISPEVRSENAPTRVGNGPELWTPHGPIEGMPVNQQQRVAPGTAVIEGDS